MSIALKFRGGVRYYFYSSGNAYGHIYRSKNRRKFLGSVTKNRNNTGSHYVTCRSDGTHIHKITNCREDADAHIIQHATQKRNIIHLPTHTGLPCSCDLGKGESMLFDREDLEVVDSFLWWLDGGIVVSRDGDGKRVVFAYIILSTTGTTDPEHKVFYKNGDPRDCRRVNIVLKTPHQMKEINTQSYNNKTTGLMGITCKREVRKGGKVYERFIVQWKGTSKSFPFGGGSGEERALDRAKQYRKECLRRRT
jgi:hypothetical protein